mmetsp:Transcript_34509/g.135733  ORF Transcript_34509/g.135733 Transcript_34509/m.135733 type:complete len:553 (-) Transcript_34509:1687-3345(-)
MAKRLYNEQDRLVQDSIEGVLLGSGGRLARLEYKNTVKVVVRNDEDFKKDKVALVCGGGSGHEPSHAGWVGKGMLSAAVCGDVFASPSTEAVLAAVKAVTGPAGCIVISKNYTGDRLNFGVAVEQAKGQGYNCDYFMVADDVAIKDAPQPRGIAGALFIIKIAGAAAELGMPKDQILQLLSEAARGVASMGMALTTCTIPGEQPSDRLAGDLAEYGLGIHGEPGRFTEPVKSSKETAQILVDHVVESLKESTGNYALLVNNLGTLPPLEMNIVVRDSVRALQGAGICVTKITVMTAMTSLDMTGFSISLCNLSGVEDYLLAPSSAGSWVPFQDLTSDVCVVDCPDVTPPSIAAAPGQLDEAGMAMKERIRAACEVLIVAEPELTAQDKIVGDGDCGLTLKQGAERILKDLDGYPLDSLSNTLNAIGLSAGQSMGGTSGVLYHLGFAAAGSSVANGGTWQDALLAGTEAISKYGGATEGMRTMLDALYPATRNSSSLEEMVAAAKKGAADTAQNANAQAGRSSYVPSDKLAGTPDPGAVAVSLWLEAVVNATK